MAQTRDWKRNREMWVRVLEKQTGKGVDAWNRRIKRERIPNERSLRTWLTDEGVTGYAQSLLVMEHFGYPEFVSASADELIAGQYADRPQLRPIFDGIIAAANELGEVILQARKKYVSLVTSRRTFARVVPATKSRVDLGLRLEGVRAGKRLQPSKIHETMRFQIALASRDELDAEVIGWLKKAYGQNA